MHHLDNTKIAKKSKNEYKTHKKTPEANSGRRKKVKSVTVR